MSDITAEYSDRKRSIRKKILMARRSLSPYERKQYSDIIMSKVLAFAPIIAADSIFAYAAMEDEVQTQELLMKLLVMGKQVSIPRIIGKRNIEAAAMSANDTLEYGAYHILTVQEKDMTVVSPAQIDCILVPGVAFSIDGTRLGMGGGYYDTYLPKAPQAVKIALAYSCQITKDIPRYSHDCNVDWIITEKDIYRAAKNGSSL